jgi:hypothetical protein
MPSLIRGQSGLLTHIVAEDRRDGGRLQVINDDAASLLRRAINEAQ